MSSRLRCPRQDCPGELKGRVCSECELHLDDIGRNEDQSPEHIASALASSGVFFDRVNQRIVFPSDSMAAAVTIAPEEFRVTEAERLAERIRFICNYAPTKFTAKAAAEFIHWLWWNIGTLPYVSEFGDKPQLFLDSSGNLVFPFASTPQGRIHIYGHQEGLRYTGPELSPRHNGEFGRFLQSCRCDSEVDREMLRTWMLASLIPSLMAPGQTPMLLLAAAHHSVGKTSLANMIGFFLGGASEVFWRPGMDLESLSRVLLGDSCRALIVDNLRPSASGHGYFDSSALAQCITQVNVLVKKLYASTGALSRLNRYAYIGTANKPQVTGEILGRSYPVTLSARQPATPNWIAHWRERRVQVLEDMMAVAIENWASTPEPQVPEGFRFTRWYQLAGRVSGGTPHVLSPTSIVRSPLELCFDWVWEQGNDENRSSYPLEEVLVILRQARNGLVRSVCDQLDLSPEGIRSALELYHSRYYIKEADLCRGQVHVAASCGGC